MVKGMARRSGVGPAIASLLLFLPVAGGCGGSEVGGPRHVVLISLDTIRTDHLGCYGSTRPETPAIDRLAAEGVLFRDVTAPAPTTLSSHTSMMTGTWPQSHGVARNGFTVNERNVMLAEIFQEAGFHTAGFLGSFALAARFGFDQGFGHFDEEFDLLVTPEREQDQRTADRVTEAALKHVDTLSDERLFLFVHYFDAHAPYAPPREYAERFVEEGAPVTSLFADVDAATEVHQGAILGPKEARGNFALQGLRLCIEGATGEARGSDEWLADLYAAEVSFLDASIRDLLDGLESRGILQEALVILTGDHGETFWEHGDFWNHGLWVHQTTAALPLILRFPDQTAAGRTIEMPVSTIDLLPTLCGIYGIETPARVEGIDLLPAVQGEEFDRGPVFCQATRPYLQIDSDGQWENARKPRSIRKGRWKYVRAPLLKVEQLFDLSADPGERRDLLREPLLLPEASTALDRLRWLMTKWERSAVPLDSRFDPSQMEDTARRLRGLGYVEDPGVSEDH
jgi:arylsulfatase A-like enzyme